jgi:tetratricopeptide (TPR) repeat protein
MKNILLASMLLMTVEVSAAPRDIDCHALVTAERDGTGESGARFLADADVAYLACTDASNPPEIRIRALNNYGLASAIREDAQRALAVYMEALTLAEDTESVDQGLLVDLLDGIWQVQASSKLPAAIGTAERASALRHKIYGDGSVEAVDGTIALAAVHGDLGNYREAERLFAQALDEAKANCEGKCQALANAYAAYAGYSEFRGDLVAKARYEELAENAIPDFRPRTKK